MKLLILSLALLITTDSFAVAVSRAAPKSSSSGAFFVEPALGYSTGILTQTGVSDISTQVVVLDGRLGYGLGSWKTGLSYLMGFGTAAQAGNKSDVKPTDLGLFLGYDLPWSLNLFGAYLFSSKVKIQSSDNSDNFTGDGSRVGIGWTGLSTASIMFEYIRRKYSKYGGASLAKPIQDTSTNVSISFPFR